MTWVARYRVPLTLVVFVVWALAPAVAGALQLVLSGDHPSGMERGPDALNELISQTVQFGFAFAILVALAAIALFRWWDVGLDAPTPLSSLRLLWFPALYLVLFLALLASIGWPSPRATFIILINTALVGMSEEIACRGILYGGLRSRLAVWPAILISSAIFGAVHFFNGFLTGDFLLAAVQSVAAFMTGIVLVAIRIRTGSLYPGIVFHALWDFLSVSAGVRMVEIGEQAPNASDLGWWILAPVALILPNFLYALFLLGHAARDEAAAEVAPPA